MGREAHYPLLVLALFSMGAQSCLPTRDVMAWRQAETHLLLLQTALMAHDLPMGTCSPDADCGLNILHDSHTNWMVVKESNTYQACVASTFASYTACGCVGPAEEPRSVLCDSVDAFFQSQDPAVVQAATWMP